LIRNIPSATVISTSFSGSMPGSRHGLGDPSGVQFGGETGEPHFSTSSPTV
jgi:hypothetical protein